MVSRPRLFRPPVRFFGRSSDFSGFVLVISAKSATEPKRRPGEVGLYCLMGITLHPFERRPENAAQRLPLPEGDKRFLPVRRLDRRAAPSALGLPLNDHRIDRLHLTAPQRLDGAADLDLVGVRGDLEHKLVVALDKGVLLRQEGSDNDLRRVFHSASSFCSCSSASRVKSRFSDWISSYVERPGRKRRVRSGMFRAESTVVSSFALRMSMVRP